MAAGVIVLDASVVIAFLDAHDAHHHNAVAAMAAHREGQLVVPASVYAEVLVRPYRTGPAAVAALEQFLTDAAISIEPITREIARTAASLRAQHASLRLPDALVLATAELLSARAALTADVAWPRYSTRARVI